MAEEKKKPKRNSTLRQMKQLYDFTRADDPQVTWWLIGAFAIPFVAIIVIAFFLKLHWFTWIMTVILAFMVGVLAATFVLSRRR